MKILFIPSGNMLGDEMDPQNTLHRCKVGLKLWQYRDFDRILVAGGIFAEGQTIPAAEVMKRWLVEAGVPADRVVIETDSLDTFENVRYGLEALMRERIDAPEFTVVTDRLHMRRLAIILRRGYGLTFTPHCLARPQSLTARLKELGSLAYHLLDPRGESAIAGLRRSLRRQPSGLSA